LKFDLREGKENVGRTKDVLKAIAGLMNRDGGRLIIGYDDDNKKVIGLEVDYPFVGRKKDWDSWLNTFNNLCKSNLGLTSTNLYVDPVKIEYQGKDLAKIVVKPSNEPVYLNDVFYLRFSGQTNELKSKELDDYKKVRFKI